MIGEDRDPAVYGSFMDLCSPRRHPAAGAGAVPSGAGAADRGRGVDRAVPLVPEVVDGRPLDLSYASLRSVSPIHCEYLRNMGLAASFSIAI